MPAIKSFNGYFFFKGTIWSRTWSLGRAAARPAQPAYLLSTCPSRHHAGCGHGLRSGSWAVAVVVQHHRQRADDIVVIRQRLAHAINDHWKSRARLFGVAPKACSPTKLADDFGGGQIAVETLPAGRGKTVHSKRSPCDEIQSVPRSDSGINTVSTPFPVPTSSSHLRVPSRDSTRRHQGGRADTGVFFSWRATICGSVISAKSAAPPRMHPAHDLFCTEGTLAHFGEPFRQGFSNRNSADCFHIFLITTIQTVKRGFLRVPDAFLLFSDGLTLTVSLPQNAAAVSGKIQHGQISVAAK